MYNNHQIKLNPSMNNEESSLLGFLKKKTLFKQSPMRYVGKRSRSKSRDGKDSIIRKVSDRDLLDQPVGRLQHTFSDKQFTKDPPRVVNYFEKEFESIAPDNSFKRGSRLADMQNNLAKSKNPEEKLNFNVQEKGNKFLTNLVTYAQNFESARVQSAHCLQSLSLKLGTEVSSINYRIDQFRNNMSKVLNSELKALREQILRLVDEAFKESERSIREYMKVEEQRLAADLLKMRQTLEKEYIRVQAMKEEISKPQWRKVTGEILATELEKSLEDLVKKSNTMEVGRWEMKNLSGQRMKTLEMELKDLVRLKQ